MRLHDILIEAISYTIEKDKIKHSILSALVSSLERTKRSVIHEINSGRIKDPVHNTLPSIFSYMQSLFPHAIKQNLLKLYSKEPYYLRNVDFVSLGRAHGQAEGVNIKLSKQTIANILYIALTNMNNKFTSRLIDSNGRANMEVFDHMFTDAHKSKDIDNIISQLTSTIIHELVHVKQHAQQFLYAPSDKQLEYRSYLNKDKNKFWDAIKKLETQEHFDMYHASPQEITAFAHNLAIELIDTVTKGLSIDDIIERDAGNFVIKRLKRVLSDASNYEQMSTYSRYRSFNQPSNEKQYKIFKRFMKLVYKEITNYINELQDNMK